MLSLHRHGLALAALSLASLVACDGGASSDTTPLPPTTAAAPLAFTLPVSVMNGLANPVPTYAVGTANVAVQGPVQAAQAGLWGVNVLNASLPVDARQSGFWSVEVSNPSLDVRGTVGAEQAGAWSVAATQAGAWRVALDGTSEVALVNSPTVELAPGTSVGIDALPPVTLAGTPAVTLAGDARVQVDGEVFVANTEEAPIPVRDVGAGRSTPWAGQRVFAIGEGEVSRRETLFEVPAGKRLVIEHFDAFIQVPGGEKALGAGLVTTVGGSSVQFVFPFTSEVALGGVDRLLVAEATTLYADPESEVGVELFRTTTVGTATGRITISGRLVDLD